MTDQKRDESTKRYQTIQQDPARRIRRIQRWIKSHPSGVPFCTDVHGDWRAHNTKTPRLDGGLRYMYRVSVADKLFAPELDWLCRYAASLMTANADYWSAIYGDLYRETLAKLTVAERTIAEQKARIESLREGLLSIQSDPTNASKDAEFYLNRDE